MVINFYMKYMQWDTIVLVLFALVAIFLGCKICSSRKKDTPWKDLKNEIGYFCFSLIVIWIINIYIGYIQ